MQWLLSKRRGGYIAGPVQNRLRKDFLSALRYYNIKTMCWHPNLFYNGQIVQYHLMQWLLSKRRGGYIAGPVQKRLRMDFLSALKYIKTMYSHSI
jgi:hypothetical protein